eukprot:scaffold41398_cov76-Phaeocystis_antarctica.AAC.1
MPELAEEAGRLPALLVPGDRLRGLGLGRLGHDRPLRQCLGRAPRRVLVHVDAVHVLPSEGSLLLLGDRAAVSHVAPRRLVRRELLLPRLARAAEAQLALPARAWAVRGRLPLAFVLLVILVTEVVGIVVVVLRRRRRLRRADLVAAAEAALVPALARLVDVAPGVLVRELPRVAVAAEAVLVAEARAVAAGARDRLDVLPLGGELRRGGSGHTQRGNRRLGHRHEVEVGHLVACGLGTGLQQPVV